VNEQRTELFQLELRDRQYFSNAGRGIPFHILGSS
jgi:hypothetical protein